MPIAAMGRTGTSICDLDSPCLQSSGALMKVVRDPSNRLESLSRSELGDEFHSDLFDGGTTVALSAF